MRAADAVFALTELRGAIMAQRVRAMARDHVRSLRIGKSAGKQEAGVHHRSVRCDARESAPRTCGWERWRTAGSCATNASLLAAIYALNWRHW